jgi:hypothetical protein
VIRCRRKEEIALHMTAPGWTRWTSHDIRLVVATVVLLFCPALASAQQPTLRFRFIGNEAFAITDGVSTIVTDFPYQSGYSGYMTYRWEDAARTAGPTTCRDHFDAALAARLGCRVAGPPPVLAQVPADTRISLDVPATIGGARITAFVTPHGAERSHYSFLVEWHGTRMYFPGDTDDAATFLAQGPLDIAFVTTWLWQAVERRRAHIVAHRIVFYHHQAGEALPSCPGCVAVDQNREFTWPPGR